LPFERWRYPPDWPEISRRIRARSGGRCEGPPARLLEAGADLATVAMEINSYRCDARQGRPHPVTVSTVVLTVAHVRDMDPMNCAGDNLAALCQRCHLELDRPHHIATARRRRRERRAAGDLFTGLYSAPKTV
jgi:hypothetical protein